MNDGKSVFVISDLHLGDGGPRDNFAAGNRGIDLDQFLDHVKAENGELVILGDLFEFWQVSLSRAIIGRRKLLDRLADMRAVYVLGNHDADLQGFVGTASEFLAHPFFATMCGPFDRTVGDKKFRFMHGHEIDEFNSGDSPSWGRMLTIFTGIFEDLNRSPILPNGQPVEGALEGFGEYLLQFGNWLANKVKKSVSGGNSPSPREQLTPGQNPDLIGHLLLRSWADRNAKGYDVAIVGHTHQSGHIGGWYFNSGGWVGVTNDFIRIWPDGTVQVFGWANRKAVQNNKELPFTAPNE